MIFKVLSDHSMIFLCFLMPWVDIYLHMIPSWCCHLDSWMTSHNTADSQVSYSLCLSGFLSLSCLDKLMPFLISSSGVCLLLLHRQKPKTLRPFCAVFVLWSPYHATGFVFAWITGNMYPLLRNYPESRDVIKTKTSRSQWYNPVWDLAVKLQDYELWEKDCGRKAVEERGVFTITVSHCVQKWSNLLFLRKLLYGPYNTDKRKTIRRYGVLVYFSASHSWLQPEIPEPLWSNWFLGKKLNLLLLCSTSCKLRLPLSK